ncbi:PXA domain-containing protein [Cantharellus anzutake]|uniref:PXA domain-containing protein n=1 Tax=Cantharellus anzutake TaxID=1750568 RepID=UPI00190655F7|nr:PXA domain-containing protein [Cantharellus anzutake]KAF8330752.1 PXA domain-containing protein [Cantharellus anzutake]
MLPPLPRALTEPKAFGFLALLAASVVLFLRLLSLSFVLLAVLCTPLIFLWFLYAQAQFFLKIDAVATRLSVSGGLKGAAKSFHFTTPAAWQAVLTRSQWSFSSPHDLPPVIPNYPQFSQAVNEIMVLIVRDFVLTWYTSVSPSPSFPSAVSDTMRASVQNLAQRAEAIDLPSLFVRQILPKINVHVDRFRDSEHTLRGAGLERHLTQSDELDILLASRYASGGTRLHLAVNNLSSTMTKHSEVAYIRSLVDRALPLLLPKKESMSRTVIIAIREILCCTVFAPIMDTLGDPDFWNCTIDQLAGAAIRQQKLVSRGIERCDSLLDARRIKNDVDAEIRKVQTLLGMLPSHDESTKNIPTERPAAYLQRLCTAKAKVEHRITVLGGANETSPAVLHPGKVPAGLKLRDVLSSPATLSYFMEFMDRRQRALLVQFWLTIETFKDPLGVVVESDFPLSRSDETAEPLPLNSIVDDVRMVHDLYFSDRSKKNALLDAISPHHVNVIQAFVANPLVTEREAFPTRARKVRNAVLLTQKQTEDDMADDFEEFKQSDLWFRVVNELARLEDNSGLEPVSNDAAVRITSPSPIRTSRAPFRIPDSVRSRVFPTFILPPTVSGPGMHRSDVTLRSSPRPRVRSFQSERVPERSPTDSPLSGSVESLPSPESRRFNAALEFLVADPGVSTRAPLFDDPDLLREEQAHAERMEALQTALTDLIADDNRQRPSNSETDEVLRLSPASEHQVGLGRPSGSVPANMGRDGSVADTRLMDKDLDLPDRDFLIRDPGDQEDEDDGDVQSGVHVASPGDLLLSYDISRLADKIQKLKSQEVMLEALSRKADLTGDVAELKLLSRSKASLAKEIRELSFQKTQYEIQEKENRLHPDRTRVVISSSVATEMGGKQVIKYLVEVQQSNPEGKPISGWVVSRRYNEFLAMHQKLKEQYASVRNLDFPGKRIVATLSSSFLDGRRIALEKYLQDLILNPVVCESDELRVFLSRESTFTEAGNQIVPKSSSFPGQDIVRNVYRSVAGSIDDMFFGPSMMDIMIQRLSRQAAEVAGIIGSAANDEDLIANAVKSPDEALLQLPGDLKVLDGEASVTSFTAPICDLVLSVFELDTKKNWLRRQAIVVILQQVLGGTIERKLRDNLATCLDDSHLWSYVKLLRDTLWPGDQWRSPPPLRTQEDKAKTRDDAQQKLSTLMPALASNMIGRSNARRGARRMFAVLQNRRLNQHIAYTILDEVFEALFPELDSRADE